MWLNSPETRAYNHAMRVRAERQSLRKSAIEIVLFSVHPGNLGELPPSPALLAYKALQLGILQPDEYHACLLD